MNYTDQQLEQLFELVDSELVEFALAECRGDHQWNWWAVRVRTDGTVYTIQEPSSVRYNDCGLTVHCSTGSGYKPSVDDNPGWAVNEDGTLNLGLWCGDALKSDDLALGWRDTLQAWAEAGNYNPGPEDLNERLEYPMDDHGMIKVQVASEDGGIVLEYVKVPAEWYLDNKPERGIYTLNVERVLTPGQMEDYGYKPGDRVQICEAM